MKYLKEYNNFKKSDINLYFDFIKEKISSFLNVISDRKYYIEKHKVNDYRIVVNITNGEMTEIVDIIQLQINKINKCIDLILYKEDSRLPKDLNNIISFLFEKIENIMEPTDNWKYNKLYSLSSIDDIRNILNELTTENYELYNSTNKYNI